MKRHLPIISLAFCFLILFISGCVAKKTYFHKSDSIVKETSAKDIHLSVELIKKDSNFFSLFKVYVENDSDSEIRIDWNQSLYFHNNLNNGKFVFKGIDPSQVKNGTVPNSEIQPKSTLTLEIAPLSKIALAGRKDTSIGDNSRLSAGMLPEGKNSVQLILIKSSETIKKTISFIIKEDVK